MFGTPFPIFCPNTSSPRQVIHHNQFSVRAESTSPKIWYEFQTSNQRKHLDTKGQTPWTEASITHGFLPRWLILAGAAMMSHDPLRT